MTYFIKKRLQIDLLSNKNLNFRISDSMNDFILTTFIEFSIKNYIDSEIPRQGQKISLKKACREP